MLHHTYAKSYFFKECKSCTRRRTSQTLHVSWRSLLLICPTPSRYMHQIIVIYTCSNIAVTLSGFSTVSTSVGTVQTSNTHFHQTPTINVENMDRSYSTPRRKNYLKSMKNIIPVERHTHGRTDGRTDAFKQSEAFIIPTDIYGTQNSRSRCGDPPYRPIQSRNLESKAKEKQPIYMPGQTPRVPGG
jgi:hypothetical protein